MDIDKLIKKKSRGYHFRIDIGNDPISGKRRQASFGPYRTKKEAKNELIKIKNQVIEKTYFKPPFKPFNEFINEWFNKVYCTGKADTTIETRRNLIDSQLISYFGGMPLEKIDVYQLDNFFSDLCNNGRIIKNSKDNEGGEENKKHLSQSYLHIIFCLLNQAFKTAVNWKLLKENPMRDVNNKPKVKSNTKKLDKALKKEELKIFLEAAKKEGVLLPFFVDSIIGVRRGELCGLKWYDIDFSSNTIQINGTLYRKRGEGLKYKPCTKTDSSDNRIIPIPDSIAELLKEEKELQDLMNEEIGNDFNGENFVFINFQGKPYDPNYLTKKFRKINRTLNIKQTTLHGLRHTAATLLMEIKVNPKIVSEILGHSRVQVTLDFYTHASQELMRKSITELENYICV